MSFATDVIPIVTDVMQLLQVQLRSQLEQQGHRLSGKLSNSIEFEISASGDEVLGKMYAEDYSGVLEFGVKPARVPYSGNGGKGGTSLYIQGLISFWEQRGLSGREAIGAAFATAKVHAREGMPSRGSFKYSSTGERTGFIRTTIDTNMDKITQVIQDRYGARLELNFGESLGSYENLTIIG